MTTLPKRSPHAFGAPIEDGFRTPKTDRLGHCRSESDPAQDFYGDQLAGAVHIAVLSGALRAREMLRDRR